MTVIRGKYFGTGPPGSLKTSGRNLGSMAYFLIGNISTKNLEVSYGPGITTQ
jgi:hypothetical protein